MNPGFDRSSLRDDAALLILSTPTTAPPVQLATSPADSSLLSPEDPATVAGWGATVVRWLRAPTTAICEHGGPERRVLRQPSNLLPEKLRRRHRALRGELPVFRSRHLPRRLRWARPVPRLDAPSSRSASPSWGAANCSTADPGFFTRGDAIEPWAAAWIQAVNPAPTPTPTPAPAPTPALTSAPALSSQTPQPGTYNGMTSQRGSIQVRVAGSSVTAAKFSFRLRCRRGAPSFTFRPLRSGPVWRLNQSSGFGFGRRFRDSTGERYRLTGVFGSTGRATGTLTSTWDSARYGNCSTGTLKWQATLTG